MKKVKFLIIVLIVLIIGIAFYLIDKGRIKKQEKPLFCINTYTSQNGEIKEYTGLGYKIIQYHILLENNEYLDKFIIENWGIESNYDYENKPLTLEIGNINVEISNKKDINIIQTILKNLNYSKIPCAGFSYYSILLSTGERYSIKLDCKAVYNGEKQAEIPENELNLIDAIVKKYIENKET